MIIYIDGKYLNVRHKTLEALGPSSFKAKGVFETMLAVDGVVKDFGLHMRRLQRGLKILGIRPPAIQAAVCKEILKRNRLSLARLRFMVWQEGKHRHVVAMAETYRVPAKKKYRVCLIKTHRRSTVRFADVKSLDYSLFADSWTKARVQGYDEALLLNRRNHIFEASRANIFWVQDGRLYTPPLSSGCLNGITRGKVIRMALHLRIPVKERNLTIALLRRAETVFLTNSLIGIMPVEINGDVYQLINW